MQPSRNKREQGSLPDRLLQARSQQDLRVPSPRKPEMITPKSRRQENSKRGVSNFDNRFAKSARVNN